MSQLILSVLLTLAADMWKLPRCSTTTSPGLKSAVCHEIAWALTILLKCCPLSVSQPETVPSWPTYMSRRSSELDVSWPHRVHCSTSFKAQADLRASIAIAQLGKAAHSVRSRADHHAAILDSHLQAADGSQSCKPDGEQSCYAGV